MSVDMVVGAAGCQEAAGEDFTIEGVAYQYGALQGPYHPIAVPCRYNW